MLLPHNIYVINLVVSYFADSDYSVFIDDSLWRVTNQILWLVGQCARGRCNVKFAYFIGNLTENSGQIRITGKKLNICTTNWPTPNQYVSIFLYFWQHCSLANLHKQQVNRRGEQSFIFLDLLCRNDADTEGALTCSNSPHWSMSFVTQYGHSSDCKNTQVSCWYQAFFKKK